MIIWQKTKKDKQRLDRFFEMNSSISACQPFFSNKNTLHFNKFCLKLIYGLSQFEKNVYSRCGRYRYTMSSLQRIEQVIARCCQRVNRNRSEITLLAVSKNRSVTEIEQLYHQGQRHFGENRLPELIQKREKLPTDIVWHMIGTLQSNKAAKIARQADWVHSLYSESSLKSLEKGCRQSDRVAQTLIEVNFSGESSKQGCGSVEQALELAAMVAASPHLRLRGVMTMAPFCDDRQLITAVFFRGREVFATMVDSFPDCRIDTLSMGMSNDFEIAIEQGATMLRIGSALFAGAE